MQTTGHTLAFALANLALHQDEQEVLLNHVQSVLPDGSLPVSFSSRVIYPTPKQHSDV
jgi:cytochrome P450